MGCVPSWMIVARWPTVKPYSGWSLVSEPSVYTIRSVTVVCVTYVAVTNDGQNGLSTWGCLRFAWRFVLCCLTWRRVNAGTVAKCVLHVLFRTLPRDTTLTDRVCLYHKLTYTNVQNSLGLIYKTVSSHHTPACEHWPPYKMCLQTVEQSRR